MQPADVAAVVEANIFIGVTRLTTVRTLEYCSVFFCVAQLCRQNNVWGHLLFNSLSHTTLSFMRTLLGII